MSGGPLCCEGNLSIAKLTSFLPAQCSAAVTHQAKIGALGTTTVPLCWSIVKRRTMKFGTLGTFQGSHLFIPQDSSITDPFPKAANLIPAFTFAMILSLSILLTPPILNLHVIEAIVDKPGQFRRCTQHGPSDACETIEHNQAEIATAPGLPRMRQLSSLHALSNALQGCGCVAISARDSLEPLLHPAPGQVLGDYISKDAEGVALDEESKAFKESLS
jgi:hypothetical protein